MESIIIYIYIFQLLEDFSYIYPNNKEGLYEQFSIFKRKILELATTVSTTSRDTTLKHIINECLDLALGIIIF